MIMADFFEQKSTHDMENNLDPDRQLCRCSNFTGVLADDVWLSSSASRLMSPTCLLTWTLKHA